MRYADVALLVGRTMMTVMFLISGWIKLTQVAATKAYFAQVHVPFIDIAHPVAVLIELAGASMLLLGIWPRVGAFLLAAYCIATAVMVHGSFATPANTINFNKNFAMAGGYLAFMVTGAGYYAVERLLAVRRQRLA